MKDLLLPSPIIQLNSALLTELEITLYVKRDDLIHPDYGGNKWRKWQHNLAAAQAANKNILLTFGGAFSNHLAATAAVAQANGFQSIGIVRGTEPTFLSPTLQFAQSKGMQLQFAGYTPFHEQLFIQFEQQYPDAYSVPMGGANQLGVLGCKDIVEEVRMQLPALPDIFCVAAGTGTTAAGMISALQSKADVWIFPALKGTFMQKAVEHFLPTTALSLYKVWEDYHFGGYAKTTPELLNFIKRFYQLYNIPLDKVYTAKMLFGVFDLIKKNCLPRGSTIMVIHTGGLQGNATMHNHKQFIF
ncbi:MAG: pyridoxal-phosphate dependent enzyme [Saprospiraceae bacterium]|nr:pyridoxal-phosphate dependent enzyme [Saprospiraceae bacterium]MBP7699676.1 pyridoxal-phosphate dependent enzyme [Saprospiraceae bacterium]